MIRRTAGGTAVFRRPSTARAIPPHGTRGTTLVEVLVASVIGLVAVVLAQQAFVGTLAAQRSAAASAEAEQAAVLATFVIGQAVAGAGAGIAAASEWLDSCPVSTDISASARPITVLITDSGSPDRPDSLIVRRVQQSRIAAPAAVEAASAAGAPLRVRSPDGFEVGDRAIVIGRDGTCAWSTINSVARLAGGVAELAHSATAFPVPITGLLLNLGPAVAAMTQRLDVAAQSLRSTDLSNGNAPNPLVANVVNVKLQYGVDRNGDGTLDDWVVGDAASGMDAASVLAAPVSALASIIALRVGVVARSEAIDPQASSSFRWVLFDCALAPPATCPGRIEGTLSRGAAGGYRYTTREAVIPLYNTLWNRPN